MEVLENELKELSLKIKNQKDFQEKLNNLKSVEPFNKYEFIISTLLSENIITYEDYIEMRDSYRFRNLFLNLFTLSPRPFGDTWGFSHLISIESTFQKPSKKIDPNYNGQYDLILPYNGNYIKIEVKASRMVDRNKSDEPMYEKALYSNSKKEFLMNFQQLKPSCCDVYVWLAVYRDTDFDKTSTFEGQIMITNKNIDSLSKYEIEGCQMRQAIIEQFEINF